MPRGGAEQGVQLDRGRILVSRGVKSLQRPRQVNLFVRPQRMQRMRSFIVAIPAVILLAGCQRDPEAPSPSAHTQREKPAVQGNKVIKVKVTAGGEITADGQPVTPEQ